MVICWSHNALYIYQAQIPLELIFKPSLDLGLACFSRCAAHFSPVQVELFNLKSEPQQKPLPGLTLTFHHIMSTRQPSRADVSLQRGQPTQQHLKVPLETIRPGRKRGGTQLIQQSTKRSRENLLDEGAQAQKTQSQLLQVERLTDIEVDGEEGLEVQDLTTLLRELTAKHDSTRLERRRHYVVKSIGCRFEGGMTETIRDGLSTLPKLSVRKGVCEGVLNLDSVPVATDQKRLDRVNEWVKQVRPCKHCKSLHPMADVTFHKDLKNSGFGGLPSGMACTV